MNTAVPPYTAIPPDEAYGVGLWDILFGCCPFPCPVPLLGIAFWVWMLVDCVLREPDRLLWILLIAFLNVPGAAIYFFVRYIPRTRLRPPRFLDRWLRRREVLRAETDARNIGNAHQHVLLGDVLRETRQHERALDAYTQAIAKDPENPQALWGAGTAARQLKRYPEARGHLATLMKLDQDYKFGDASLAYGQTLLDLGDHAAARPHIEAHIARRGDPEAKIMLASLHVAEGRPAEARALLEPLIIELKPAHDARNRRARSDAARLLRKLPR